MLFEKDSYLDLCCRGYSRAYILEHTGIDVGYNGNSVRKQLVDQDGNKIDLLKYKLVYVKQNYTTDDMSVILVRYENGLDRNTIKSELGVPFEHLSLRKVYREFDMENEFLNADKQRIKNGLSEGMINKYGVDNPFKLKCFQERAKHTREQQYGAAYTLANGSSLQTEARMKANINAWSDTARVKRQQTVFDRFGVNHVMRDDNIRKKVYISRFGEGYLSKRLRPKITIEEKMSRLQNVLLDKYGVKYARQRDDLRCDLANWVKDNKEEYLEKIRTTNMVRYGVPYYSQADEARKKQSERMLDKDYNRRIVESKKRNGTINSSQLESRLMDNLGSDWVSQYNSKDYPYYCDFYNKQLDCYLEINGYWAHGGHWFDFESKSDQDVRCDWIKKNTTHYNGAIDIWCNRDVMKRQVAKQNNLNYVVCWDGLNGADVKLWCAMGCPRGRDYDEMYSWLPKRVLKLDRPQNNSVSDLVRYHQQDVFYKNEKRLWQNNPYGRKWGTLQANLYANRYRYLGKLPSELNVKEILRGLKISGLVKGYTIFDHKPYIQFLKDYCIESVYDPCAGWGERLVSSVRNGVEYRGCDVNLDLKKGYDGLQYDLGVSNCIVYTDSSKYDMRQAKHDCVFTCPPYWNIEMYSELGAENLSYDDFLQWWSNVIMMSVGVNTKVFAFQMNKRFSSDMVRCVEQYGWVLSEVRVLNNKISHFNRKHRKKQEGEAIFVFQRVT